MSIINQSLTLVSNSISVAANIVQAAANLSNTAVTITATIDDTTTIYKGVITSIVEANTRSIISDLNM